MAQGAHEVAPGDGGGFSNITRLTAEDDNEPDRRRPSRVPLQYLLMYGRTAIPKELIEIYEPKNDMLTTNPDSIALRGGEITTSVDSHDGN